MKWNTNRIVEQIKNLPGVKKVLAHEPGGDYDTENLVICGLGKSKVYLCGYNRNGATNPNEMEIEALELRDGCDSQGGLASDNKNVIELYCTIRSFVSKLDVNVIDSWEEIF